MIFIRRYLIDKISYVYITYSEDINIKIVQDHLDMVIKEGKPSNHLDRFSPMSGSFAIFPKHYYIIEDGVKHKMDIKENKLAGIILYNIINDLFIYSNIRRLVYRVEIMKRILEGITQAKYNTFFRIQSIDVVQKEGNILIKCIETKTKMWKLIKCIKHIKKLSNRTKLAPLGVSLLLSNNWFMNCLRRKIFWKRRPGQHDKLKRQLSIRLVNKVIKTPDGYMINGVDYDSNVFGDIFDKSERQFISKLPQEINNQMLADFKSNLINNDHFFSANYEFKNAESNYMPMLFNLVRSNPIIDLSNLWSVVFNRKFLLLKLIDGKFFKFNKYVYQAKCRKELEKKYKTKITKEVYKSKKPISFSGKFFKVITTGVWSQDFQISDKCAEISEIPVQKLKRLLWIKCQNRSKFNKIIIKNVCWSYDISYTYQILDGIKIIKPLTKFDQSVLMN